MRSLNPQSGNPDLPGASSTKILSYIDVHFKGESINTVIVLNGTNDLVYGTLQSIIDASTNIKNLKEKRSEECFYFGISFCDECSRNNTRKISCFTFKFLWK